MWPAVPSPFHYASHDPFPNDLRLIIEVADSYDFDVGEKLALYAAANVCDYCTVDLQRRKLFTCGKTDDCKAYSRTEGYAGAGTLSHNGFSEMPVVELFVPRS